MKEKTAAYIRVSTQEQKMHGLSIDAQIQKLTDYAEANNLEIVEWYNDEGVSGRKEIRKRPALQRMIKDAQAKKFRRIIFIKLDRFFRSVAEYHECMKAIDPCIWTATEERYDLSTANGRAFVNMKITIAELEADQTGERIRLVNEYKVRQGMPLYGNHIYPFCYEYSREQGKVVKRNEDMFWTLLEAVESTKSVRRGIIAVKQKYGKEMTYQTAEKVLANTMIYGTYRDNPAYCEPYIDKARFDEMQRTLANLTRHSRKFKYVFSGLVLCPECGRKLSGHQLNYNRNNKDIKYAYYRCNNCSFAVNVSEARLEQMLIERVTNELTAYNITADASGHDQSPQIDTAPLLQELNRINYMFEKGRITVEEYDTKYTDLNRQIEEAKHHNSTIPTPRAIAGLPPDWQNLYASLDPESKCAFWKSIINPVQIHWEKGAGATRYIERVTYK